MSILSASARLGKVCHAPRWPHAAPLATLTSMMMVILALIVPAIAAADLDGRAFEMVSPPNKNGGQIEAVPLGSGVIQASTSGEEVAYLATVPFGQHVEGNTTEFAQMLAVRESSGWRSSDITTHDSGVVGKAIGVGNEYRFFSSDLSSALVEQLSVGEEPPLLSSEAAERTIYVRNDVTDSYRPLVTRANTRKGAVIKPVEELLARTFVAATPNLEYVVLASYEALTPDAAPVSRGYSGTLYEWANGALELVSVLPDGHQALPPGGADGAFLGNDPPAGNVRNAISSNGDRVVWGDEESTEERSLFMSDMVTGAGKSVQLDAAQGVEEPEEHEAVFQAASTDGSRVFFTDGQALTRDSTAGGFGKSDLYVCDIHEEAGGLVCHLEDLTVDQNHGESARVRGDVEGKDVGTLIGAAENGRSVYFIARGVLTTAANSEHEVAKAGQNNLYTESYDAETGVWTRQFIATLSEEDVGDWGRQNGLRALTASASPNGQYLVFMSDQELTGYNNTDINSGKHDEEVFLYNATTNDLACVSCHPSGGQPTGMLDQGALTSVETPLVDGAGAWVGHWLAGSVSGWTSLTLSNSLYQPRYLSNTGRLFFDSTDDLTNRAVNGQEDVYEYEPAGVGGCTGESVTFSAASGGCVELISGGTSSEESAFVDASESGDDVFFVTAAQLVPQDVDHSLDLYDAHVCSQEALCFSPVASQPPLPCDESGSCRNSSQTAVMEPPASVTFVGAGDVIQQSAKQEGTNRARKDAAALKKCRRREPKRKLDRCKASKRAKYARTSTSQSVASLEKAGQ